MSTIGNERAEKALADKTRTTFNEAAQGKGGLSEGEKKERPDKAAQDHNIEPSMAEKKQGAALDKASAQKMFEQHKTKQQSLERKGAELGR
jgi:hypothetical protein